MSLPFIFLEHSSEKNKFLRLHHITRGQSVNIYPARKTVRIPLLDVISRGEIPINESCYLSP